VENVEVVGKAVELQKVLSAHSLLNHEQGKSGNRTHGLPLCRQVEVPKLLHQWRETVQQRMAERSGLGQSR